MVKFEKFTEENAKEPYSTFFDGVSIEEVYDVKGLSYEDKLRFMRYIMGDDGLMNASLLTNILIMVNGKNLEDDVFEKEEVIFRSLEEYIDLKFDLKDELRAFEENLLLYFLGAVKSYSVILPDNKKDVPMAYRLTLSSLDLAAMSKIMNRVHVNIEDVPLVFDAEDIMLRFTGAINVMNAFAEYLRKNGEDQ